MKKADSFVAAGLAAFMAVTLVSAGAGAAAPNEVKVNDNQIKESLTGETGDAAAGKKWFADRKLGNCLACHMNKDMAGMPFHGEVGPPIDGVADRYSAAELRAILVNSKAVLGDATIMPAFYRVDPGARVMDKFKGKTILSGQQIEDIVAYLLTLKE